MLAPVGKSGRIGGCGGLPIDARLTKIAQSIFIDNGLDGFMLDARWGAYLYQNSTGTTPVTAVTQPAGLMLDKHLGLQLGPELIALADNRDFTSDTGFWTKNAGWTISGGVASFNSATGNLLVSQSLGSIANKWFRAQFDVTNYVSGSSYVQFSGVGAAATGTATTSGTRVIYIQAQSGANGNFAIGATGGSNFSIDNISVKLLGGNHPLQATDASRPTWQVDAGGYHLIRTDGVDDSLSSATGGGGNAGMFYCAALNHAAGGGVIHTLFSDVGTNTGYEVELDITDKLSFSAYNGVLPTTLASTAAINTGVKTELQAWDDGTNMNVRVNGGTTQSVARPAVSAGTAGFTLFKDNGAALHFAVGDFYRLVYVKNSGLTEAQRHAMNEWVRYGAGL